MLPIWFEMTDLTKQRDAKEAGLPVAATLNPDRMETIYKGRYDTACFVLNWYIGHERVAGG